MAHTCYSLLLRKLDVPPQRLITDVKLLSMLLFQLFLCKGNIETLFWQGKRLLSVTLAEVTCLGFILRGCPTQSTLEDENHWSRSSSEPKVLKSFWRLETEQNPNSGGSRARDEQVESVFRQLRTSRAVSIRGNMFVENIRSCI